jgi:hypothetical protein
VVHTNGMLDLYQKLDVGHRNSNVGNVISSLIGIRESILRLEKKIEKKLGNEPREPILGLV